jgi:hypothetical protein
LLVCFALVSGCGSGGGNGENALTLGPPIFDQSGIGSSVTYSRMAIIRNQPSWNAVWAEHDAGIDDADSPPRIDFSRFDILVIFSDIEASPGQPPVLDRITTSVTHATVYVTMTHRPGNLGFNGRTYFIRTIPKTPDLVTFNVTDVY